MLQIVFLIAGIIVAFRRLKLRRLTAADYPDVDPKKFEEWQIAQLSATDTLLWATWGAFFIILFLLIIPFEPAGVFQLIGLFGSVVWCGFAWGKSDKAKKLGRDAGIRWPK